MTTIVKPDKVTIWGEDDEYLVRGAKIKERTNRIDLKIPKAESPIPPDESVEGYAVLASDPTDGAGDVWEGDGALPENVPSRELVYDGEIDGETTAGKMSARWRIFRCEPDDLP